jgi:hypothetical protein
LPDKRRVSAADPILASGMDTANGRMSALGAPAFVMREV